MADDADMTDAAGATRRAQFVKGSIINIDGYDFLSAEYYQAETARAEDVPPDVMERLQRLNFGLHYSHALSSAPVTPNYQGHAGLSVMTIPTGTYMYKGMDVVCPDVLDTDNVDNQFARTRTWYGDLRTAAGYAEELAQHAEHYRLPVVSGVFAFTTTRPVRLFNLMSKSSLTHLWNLTVAAIDADPNQHRRLSQALLALSVATGLDMSSREQERASNSTGMKKHFVLASQDFPAPELEVYDTYFGASTDCLNRMTLLAGDADVVWLLQEMMPALDGYFAYSVPSLWSWTSQFHPEICMFDSYQVLKRAQHSIGDDCSTMDKLDIHKSVRPKGTQASVTHDKRLELQLMRAQDEVDTRMHMGGGFVRTPTLPNRMLTRVLSVPRASSVPRTLGTTFPEFSSAAGRHRKRRIEDYAFYKNIRSVEELAALNTYLWCGRGDGHFFPSTPMQFPSAWLARLQADLARVAAGAVRARTCSRPKR